MRKLLPVFLFLLFASPVHADYQTAKADYVYQYSLYRTASDAYQLAKSTFMTYRTLTAQNDAIDKERAVIAARDRVISAYYNLLQEKLNATSGVSPDFTASFNNIKESEKTWLADHQKKIDAAGSFDDLNGAAKDFESRFPQFDNETKNAFGIVIVAKETNLKLETDQNVAALKAKLSQMQNLGENTQFAQRGLINVQNKIDLSAQKTNDAKTIFLPGARQTEPINLYNGQQRLTEANQSLREAVTFLLEIIKSITG